MDNPVTDQGPMDRDVVDQDPMDQDPMDEGPMDQGPMDEELVTVAASIWAQAKAQRDQASSPGSAEDALPGLRRRLGLEGARLLVEHRDDRPVGFILFAPQAQALEIFYLAVSPSAWGRGVGTSLLQNVETEARDNGRTVLELWVIDDNERAVRVYERAGFTRTEDVKRDHPEGRLERRFVRHLELGRPSA